MDILRLLVGSIINCFSREGYRNIAMRYSIVAVNSSKLRAMASDTVEPCDLPFPHRFQGGTPWASSFTLKTITRNAIVVAENLSWCIYTAVHNDSALCLQFLMPEAAAYLFSFLLLSFYVMELWGWRLRTARV